MNTPVRALIALIAVWLPAHNAAAAGFTTEQYTSLDGTVGTTISGLKDDGANMDALLKALGDAYNRSTYGKEPASQNARENLVAQSNKLKQLIVQVNGVVDSLRPHDSIPAVMVYVLSREQTVSFEVYKWCRSVIELTDLANASVRHYDAEGAQLATLMMHEGEAQQDTISTEIQIIADKVLEIPSMP